LRPEPFARAPKKSIDHAVMERPPQRPGCARPLGRYLWARVHVWMQAFHLPPHAEKRHQGVASAGSEHQVRNLLVHVKGACPNELPS
jgi:hypothetical protein